MTWRLGNLTEGERSFVLAHLATGLFGAGVALVAVMRLGGGMYFSRPISGYEIWMVIAGGLGGGLGLYLNRHRMGAGGPRGVLQAFGAIILTNIMGGVIGGTLALPLYGTMFGPFALAMILLSSPFMFLLWLANQLGSHLLMARYHTERDSIFRAQTASA